MDYSRVLCYPPDLIYKEDHAVVFFFTRCRVFKVGKIITYMCERMGKRKTIDELVIKCK